MAQFTIRIPDELHDYIKAAAAEDKRSMNGEVHWLLETGRLTRDNVRRAAPRATSATAEEGGQG